MSVNSVVMTVSGRCEYLEPVLESWQQVDGVRGWNWIFGVEPCENQSQVEAIIIKFAKESLYSWQLIVHDERKGVLENPFWCLDRGFKMSDYVVLAEEDLVVASDILRYHEWASEKFKTDHKVLTVNSHANGEGPDNEVVLNTCFSPWIWGTWIDRWEKTLRPTWDHNYSTFTDFPGHQSGWDWQINKRIMPKNDFRAVYPLASRVQNIGVVGTHAQPQDFAATQVPFQPNKLAQNYILTSL